MNWLPPLLEQIALNPKTAAVPIVDKLNCYNFEYLHMNHGARGSFDWQFSYKWLVLTEKYQKTPGDVYQLSAMTGGAYAIDRKYFFYLGGYDEGMKASFPVIFKVAVSECHLLDLEWREL